MKKNILDETLPASFGLLNRIVLLGLLVVATVAAAMLAWNLYKMRNLDEQFEFIYEASHA